MTSWFFPYIPYILTLKDYQRKRGARILQNQALAQRQRNVSPHGNGKCRSGLWPQMPEVQKGLSAIYTIYSQCVWIYVLYTLYVLYCTYCIACLLVCMYASMQVCMYALYACMHCMQCMLHACMHACMYVLRSYYGRSDSFWFEPQQRSEIQHQEPMAFVHRRKNTCQGLKLWDDILNYQFLRRCTWMHLSFWVGKPYPFYRVIFFAHLRHHFRLPSLLNGASLILTVAHII